MPTFTYPDVASLEAAIVALSKEQCSALEVDPVFSDAGAPTGYSLTVSDDIAPLIGAPMPVKRLLAYADAKQIAVLSALEVSYALKDGTATLDTMCDPGSITFLNSLGSWVALNAAVSPAPTRVFYNLDGSAVQVTPAQMGEFLSVVGVHVQSTFDALATVRSAIGIAPATITTTAQIDAFAWPTSAAA